MMNTQTGADNGQVAEQANPELDRILAELAGYTANQNASYQPPALAPPSHSHDYVDHQPQPTSSSQTLPTIQQHRSQAPVSIPSRQTATPPAQSNSSQIDPSTIFEWPQALRCVNKISASNPQFGPKIKEVSDTFTLTPMNMCLRTTDDG